MIRLDLALTGSPAAAGAAPADEEAARSVPSRRRTQPLL